jgi:predicted nucleic acid-binding protein
MIVVDASVAVKWILWEEFSGEALRLLADCESKNIALVGPFLLPFEVSNVLRQKMRRDPGQFLLTQAKALRMEFDALPIQLTSPTGLADRALEIADRYALPAIYDAYYVALAELLVTPLWTNDTRLLKTLGNAVPFVRPISSYAGSPIP